MTKNDRIKNLFKTKFGDGEWDATGKRTICKFKCTKCSIEPKSPRYSGLLGSDDTDVMLIAEAPSASNGVDAYFGGQLEIVLPKLKASKSLGQLIDFTKSDGKTPYFTDVCKCGVSKQNKKSGLSKARQKNCINNFLKDEILIIEPRIIYCIGKTAYIAIKTLKNDKSIAEESPKLFDILKQAQIVELIHYSNQAGFPLKDSDKLIIWEIQSGRIPKKDFAAKILSLDFIKKLERYL